MLGIDVLDMESIPNVTFLKSNLLLPETMNLIQHWLKGEKADVVMSDMAPNTTGDRFLDSYHSSELCKMALKVATQHLHSDGTFLCKVVLF